MSAKSRKKRIPILAILFVLSVTLAVGVYFADSGKKTMDSARSQMFNEEESKATESKEASNTTKASIAKPEQPVQKETAAKVPETTTQEQIKKSNSATSSLIRAGTVKPGGKQMAITFDSGWLFENTVAILNALDQYNIKTTFFARGYWVKEHPDLAREIVKRGHDLENHSLTHGHMTALTDAGIRNELRRSTEIIHETTGFRPKLFRPPYGEFDNRMLRIVAEEGYVTTVLWTIDSHDWAEVMNGQRVTKSYLVSRILDKASDGGIVLMHVGGYETVEALPEIIQGLISSGYKLVPVKELL